MLNANPDYILSIDQGTTSTRAILFNLNGTIKYQYSEPLKVYHLNSGFASIKPMELYKSVENCLKDVHSKYPTIKGIGLTNQRETTLFWTTTGDVIDDGILWYDSRTNALVEKYIKKYKKTFLQHKTGLSFSTYFSALKIVWMIENNDLVRTSYHNKTLRVGTVDTFLLFKLTGEYKTDITNASRTMLMNLKTGQWDKDILELFNLSELVLPTIHASDHSFGKLKISIYKDIPICGVLGDQQAALIGHNCLPKGSCKATYGTGAFILMVTDLPIISKHGLITTVAYELNGIRRYALEGAVSNVGSVITWMEQLGLFKNGQDLNDQAQTSASSNGLVFIPALSGFFAPYWKPLATGSLLNLQYAHTKGNIAFAFLESISIQIKSVLQDMEKDANTVISELKVDGGVCNSNVLMQLQSDMTQLPVMRPLMREASALGCFIAAGLSLKLITLDDDMQRNYEHYLPKQLDQQVVEQWESKVNDSLGLHTNYTWLKVSIAFVSGLVLMRLLK